MTKKQYLMALETALRKLPADEREEMLQDFEEHFAIGSEEGKSETEITEALGSPQQIAKETIATYHLDQAESNATTGNIFRAVWAAVGLSFFNLVIVLGPFIAIVGIVSSGWIAGIAFIGSPLLLLINVIMYPNSFELVELFTTLGLCGLGIFIIMGMYIATKGLMKGFMTYLQFNMNLVKGGLHAQ